MLPTSLPELPKPSIPPRKSRKPYFLNPIFYMKIQGKSFNFRINPFKGLHERGGEFYLLSTVGLGPTLSQRPQSIRGSHPWLTILLLPGFWACNIVLSLENSIGFTRVLLGISRVYFVLLRFY